jgi:hypothetical protein
MSFKTFIYYCCLSGGWAAFLAWLIVYPAGIAGRTASLNPLLSVPLTGAILGLLIAAAIGTMDALLNAVGPERYKRVGLCLLIGMGGGMISSLVGQLLLQVLGVPLVGGWMLTGMFVGASIGIFDWLRAIRANENTEVPFRKVLHGIIGGVVGGFIGGLPYAFLINIGPLGRSSLLISLVILGLMIGLMIGLAQVFLKEAWIKVEAGFRAGREVMLSKEETLIGRAEACDIGLFRDNTIEKKHARIALLKTGDLYVLCDEETPGGTFLNEVRITKPTPLKNGDLIRIGNSQLRFGEREKRPVTTADER